MTTSADIPAVDGGRVVTRELTVAAGQLGPVGRDESRASVVQRLTSLRPQIATAT